MPRPPRRRARGRDGPRWPAHRELSCRGPIDRLRSPPKCCPSLARVAGADVRADALQQTASRLHRSHSRGTISTIPLRHSGGSNSGPKYVSACQTLLSFMVRIDTTHQNVPSGYGARVTVVNLSGPSSGRTVYPGEIAHRSSSPSTFV